MAGISPPETRTHRFLEVERHGIRRPVWGHPLGYISRKLENALAEAIRGLDLKGGMRLVDYGCADMPYRGYIPSGVEYLGADLPGNPAAIIAIQPDGRLALPDAACDAVLSSQVLEHVNDPATYLAECFRVLKPGGRLVLSTHGIMVYHRDPVDYWRWTGEGLQHILVRAGFRIREFSGVMGLAAVGLQLFQDATIGHVPRFLRRPYAAVMQTLVSLFDCMHSPTSRAENALVFIAVAEKAGHE